MDRIGITERGDAGLDFNWERKINSTVATILITKNLNSEFIQRVLNYKDKVIIHITCAGYGSTVLEPNVPTVFHTIRNTEILLKQFPKQQVVLRLDPIFPTLDGWQVVNEVLNAFYMFGIKRVRYSFVDMYCFVYKRIENTELGNLKSLFDNTQYDYKFINEMIKEFPSYEFESCAESNNDSLGCISQKDLQILGIDLKLSGSSNQRKNCKCPNNKFELFKNKHQCNHKCVYCYWKSKPEMGNCK